MAFTSATAKRLPRRELEYIAVQASEEVDRLEGYCRELLYHIKLLEEENNEMLAELTADDPGQWEEV